MELAEIIAKLKATEGPDRTLDEAIEMAVHPMLATLPRTEIGGWMHPTHGMVAPPQHYTASLDAALMLVPEGYNTSIEIASFQNAAWVQKHGEPVRSDYGTKRAPAIALCIAALGARVAQAE